MGIELAQSVILLVIAALIFGKSRLRRYDSSLRSQLQRELGRQPVYSAETTNGKEAEFIRDRLPKRFPMMIVVVAVVILAAAAWWIAR